MRRGIQAALLIISAIGFYLIYKSIQTPIEFARESKARFAKVIATLKDIRKSEEAYEAINKTYTNNFADLEKFIEEKRESGIYMSVLGFGMGNYRDDMAETIADKGNGNYAYIDDITEAKKVLVNEFSGTLFTVAKDVKLQLEFNPKYVKEYKLIGYENRMLANEDFTDDKKDAGEIGAGHTVTAFYELVPADGKMSKSYRYQTQTLNEKGEGNEIGFLKIRYKDPKVKDAKSVEVTEPLVFEKKDLKDTSVDFRFAASVAEFGILLRNNSNKAQASYGQVVELANGAIGKDEEGYRKEFVRLVKSAELLAK